jgi:hypothetical protein
LKIPLLNLLIQDLGPFQSHGNTRADVACADVLLKFGLMHQAGGLFAGAAEDEAAACRVHSIGQVFESLQAGGVDGRHVSETQHNDGREFRDALDQFVDFIGGAKKKRAVDAEDGHVGRDLFVLKDMHVAFPTQAEAYATYQINFSAN